jgi:D-alanyl-D-alanine dipeptidase/CubicO group peptidase (beta-lactamase class C family)
MRHDNLPGISIAFVDDNEIVWARGFGYADVAHKIPATADTIYRVGAISRLVTDAAILARVDRAELHLDAPSSRYLPVFHPSNPFTAPVTLRELMADRSGLVREPPIGGIYDSSSPSLIATVQSLNETRLLYWPVTHQKVSEAGIAVLGEILQRETGQSFAGYLRRTIFDPVGMSHSSFESPAPNLAPDLAAGEMWTYDGETIATPHFEPGVAPAVGLYTSVEDLGRFLAALFESEKPSRTTLLAPQTVAQMWTPQFVHPDAAVGMGLGFRVGRFADHRLAYATGSLYGYAAEILALPGQRLGVVVATNVAEANGATSEIAGAALRWMLAARRGHRPPELAESVALPAASARSLAGRYGSLATAFDLVEREGRLYFLPNAGGPMVHVRQLGRSLLTDGRLGYGLELTPIPGGIRIGDTIFPSYTLPKPKPAPAAWNSFIGEYGWPYATLYILERNGRLAALLPSLSYAPLVQLTPSSFAFPHGGPYDGEKIVFARGPRGVAPSLTLGDVRFPRRTLGGISGPFFHIHPLKPVPELRREALRAKPPREQGDFRKPDLVDVAALDPKIHLDIRYATSRDFLGAPVYTEAKAFLQRPAALALVRVAHRLERQGYGLLIHDAYRPWYVTKIFWDATPPDKRIFVADPREGSRHNRGCAVDLTLYSLATGKQVPMTGHYDEMTERSYAFYPGGTSLERWDRNLLRRAMTSEGFQVYPYEWWHFDYHGWRRYPILNLTFEQLSRAAATAEPQKEVPDQQ